MSDAKEKPLKKSGVSVEAEPASSDRADAAKRIAGNVKEQVKKAIQESERSGAERQLGEADHKAREALEKVSKSDVKKLKVKVTGTDADGNDVERSISGTPKGKG